MKLYKHTKKRLAKKLLGDSWKKMLIASKLKPGDIVHTCKGYNEKIETIEPSFFYFAKGRVTFDFDIETEVGGCCSVRHCITFPVFSKSEILEQWKHWANSPSEWNFGEQHNIILNAVKNGEDPFDENGCLKREYSIAPWKDV